MLLNEDLQIYVRPGVTDMRKQINGLSIIASEVMELSPGSGSLFLFCSRSRKNWKGGSSPGLTLRNRPEKYLSIN